MACKRRYLCAPINEISGAQLPSSGEVLGLLTYKLDVEKMTVVDASRKVSKIVEALWAKARIPMQRIDTVVKNIQTLYKEYTLVRKNKARTTGTQVKREEEFKERLANLFDVAKAGALETMTNEEDKAFLLAQREPGRRGRMGGADTALAAQEQRSSQRQAAQEVRKRRAEEEASTSAARVQLEDSSSTSSSTSAEGSPTRGISPVPPKRPRANLNIVTPDVAASLDRVKVSDRGAVFVLTETARALGHDTVEYNINRTSIQSQRRRHREQLASALKEKLRVEGPLVVHWDGKLMPDLTSNAHVDRLPILVSGGGEVQLLQVAKLPSGTGANEAKAVVEALEKWSVADRVVGMSFDTTAANTGRHTGACTLIERQLKSDLLYLACRHHILELVIEAVFTSVMGPTTGPAVLLFKRFQERWPFINQGEFQPIEDGAGEVDIEWFLQALKERTDLRDDYRELLELTVIFLGGVPPRGIRFRAPGPMHHARWMSKVLYSLKVWLFRGQVKLTPKEERGLLRVAMFSARLYSKAWTQAPLAVAAPLNDLQLLQALDGYEDAEVSKAATNKLLGHLWYLSEELVALAFFDDRVSSETKKKMVAAIEEKDGNDTAQKRVTIPASAISGCSLEDFVTSNTSSFFSKMSIDKGFLALEPADWKKDEAYGKACKALGKLSVTNDHAERGVALIQEYNRLLTKDEEQLQFLVQVVADHRRQFPDTRKGTLARTGRQ